MKKISINTFSNKVLAEYYKKMLCKVTGYYANGTMYRFIYSSMGTSLVPTDMVFTPQILVVSREYYQEKLIAYPIGDKKELVKLLALEFSSNRTTYQIVEQHEGVSKVNVWQLNESLPTAKIIVPESFLLAQMIDEQILLIQQCLTSDDESQLCDKKLYISHSQQGVLSAYSGQLINTSERFYNSIGKNLQATEKLSAATELPLALIKGIIAAPINQLFSFSQQHEQKNSKNLLKSVALPILTMFSLYLAGSSAWLYWQQSSLQQQVSSQKAGINQALNNQEKYNRVQNELLAYNGLLAEQQAKSLAWLILASIIEDVKVRTLRYANGRYIIIGQTHRKQNEEAGQGKDGKSNSSYFKSTDLLEKLLQQNFIIDAKFDSAVRRSRDYESFTVSFLLDNEAIKNESLNKEGEVNTSRKGVK